MTCHGHNLYILGAGFSERAGMPLIKNFIQRLRDTRELNEHLKPGATAALQAVLDLRAKLSSVRDKVHLDLDNIEELLSLTDANSTPGLTLSDDQRQIRKAISATLQHTATTPPPIPLRPTDRKELVRLLPGSTLDQTEPYDTAVNVDPYTFFAGLITHQLDNPAPDTTDTVLSFNYDLILERSLKAFGVTPDYALPDATYETPLGANTLRVIKLHGSTNWTPGPNNTIRIVNDPRELIEDPTKHPVLLPPTWHKGTFATTLASLWTTAVDAITTATRIIIIGYSFPQNDTHFRYLLAAGLNQNHTLRSLITIKPTSDTPTLDTFLDTTYFEHRRKRRASTLEVYLSETRLVTADLDRGHHLHKQDRAF